MADALNRRVQVTVLGGVAIFLALGRCSPVAPSIPKSSLYGERQGLAGNPILPGQSDSVVLSLKIQSRIVSVALPDPKDFTNLSGNTARLGVEQLTMLRNNGRADLTLHPGVIGQPLAFLRPNQGAAIDSTLLATLELTLNQTASGSFRLVARDPNSQLASIEELLLVTDSNLVSQDFLSAPAPADPAPELPKPEPS